MKNSAFPNCFISKRACVRNCMSILSAPTSPKHYERRRLRALEHLERQASSGSAFKHIGHALEPSCLCACVPVRLPARARVHPSSQRISHRGAQPGRAKRGPAARSAAAAEGGRRRRRPRAARGPPSKARMRINCRDSAAAYKLPWSAGKRALHVRDNSLSATGSQALLI